MKFAEAIKALKNGAKIARASWAEKNIWLVYGTAPIEIPAAQFKNPLLTQFAEANGGMLLFLPGIIMKTPAGKFTMGWHASQGEYHADDWLILDAPPK